MHVGDQGEHVRRARAAIETRRACPRGSGGAANDGVIYSATFGTTASTTITHGLGKQFCLAQVYDVSTPYGIVDANIKMDSTTACTVELASAPGADTRRLVLMAVA